MSSTRDVPEPWASAMQRRGLTRPDGSANISALARKAGLAIETARRAVHGVGVTRPETVAALMDVLGKDVQSWLGARVELGPYVPPAESSLLTTRQRDAVTELIRAMTERRAEESDPGGNTAPTTNVTPLRTASDDAHDPTLPPEVDQAAYTTGQISEVEKERVRQDQDAGE